MYASEIFVMQTGVVEHAPFKDFSSTKSSNVWNKADDHARRESPSSTFFGENMLIV